MRRRMPDPPVPLIRTPLLDVWWLCVGCVLFPQLLAKNAAASEKQLKDSDATQETKFKAVAANTASVKKGLDQEIDNVKDAASTETKARKQEAATNALAAKKAGQIGTG